MKHGAVFLVLLFGFFSFTAVYADVIRMQDGRILLGKVTSTDSQGIVINSFGQSYNVSQNEIAKSEKDFASLQKQPVEIYLKDGSIIKGRIQNYDDEIGILVNIDIGALTLPVQNVKVIEDPDQRIYYNGYPFQIGFSAGYFLPQGDAAKSFDNGMNFSLFFEFDSGLYRGLFWGVDLKWFSLKYSKNSDYSYSMMSGDVYAMYKFLFFRSSQSLLSHLVPFVSLGGGPAYITLEDKRSDAVQEYYSEVDIKLTATAGFDVMIGSRAFVRAGAQYFIITQKKTPFNAFNCFIGSAVSF
jgi:hypothetical protein